MPSAGWKSRNWQHNYAQPRQRLCIQHRQPDFVLCVLFIERLENPSPLVSLRRAESESGSHHYLRWVLLAGSLCAAQSRDEDVGVLHDFHLRTMVSPVMSVKRLVGRVPSFGFPSERRSGPAGATPGSHRIRRRRSKPREVRPGSGNKSRT